MKIIYIFILLNTIGHASYIQMIHYAKQNNYEKVLQEAKYSFKDYQNPKLHMLWAVSAQKLGKTTEAMGAYERVLILEPHNNEAKVALSAIYKKTHRSGLNIDTSNTKQKNNKLRAKATLDIGYDTNVNVNASGDALDGYYGIDLGLDKISSIFARTTANISYMYKLDENDNWFIQSTLDMYYQNNFNAHTYDLTIPTLEIALGYVNDDYLLYLPVSYNNINYLDKNLLNLIALIPRVRVAYDNYALWDIAVIYNQRNYINTIDKTKDATTFGFETGIYYSLDNAQIQFNIKYESRSADNTIHDRFVDANFLSIDTNIKYTFTPSFYTKLDYLFRYSDYSDDIGTDDTPSSISRDDYINELDLKLSYIFNKDIEIYIRNIYTHSLSTYIPSEYNKNITLLGLQVRY